MRKSRMRTKKNPGGDSSDFSTGLVVGGAAVGLVWLITKAISSSPAPVAQHTAPPMYPSLPAPVATYAPPPSLSAPIVTQAAPTTVAPPPVEQHVLPISPERYAELLAYGRNASVRAAHERQLP